MAKNIKLIQASAGSGKTTNLITHLLDSLDCFYREKQVYPNTIVSTFTRKATREIVERLMVKVAGKADVHPSLIHYISYSPLMQIGTLHGIFYRLLKTYGSVIDLCPEFDFLETKNQEEQILVLLDRYLIKDKLGEILLEHYSFREIAGLINRYLKHVQKFPQTPKPFSENELSMFISGQSEGEKKTVSCKEYENLSYALQHLGKKVALALQLEKTRSASLDFGNLEPLTLKLMQNVHRIPHFPFPDLCFLDEYQDVNPLQKQILDIYCQKSETFIVGDPGQSIYYFRGSDPQVFSDKEKEVKAGGGVFEQSHVNYRSSGSLISCFNQLFAPHFKKMDVPLVKKDSEKPPVSNKKTKPEEQDNTRKREVFSLTLLREEQDVSGLDSEQLSKQEHFLLLEFKAIRKKVEALLSAGESPGEIAVFSTRNNRLFSLAQYLVRQGIPVNLHSSGSFHKKGEIKDALCLLYFLIAPHHDQNLISLLRTPYQHIADGELGIWLNQKKEREHPLSLWGFLKKHQSTHPGLQGLFHAQKRVFRVGFTVAFQEALESLRFFDCALYQDSTGLRESNLWKLISHLKEFEREPQHVLLEFISLFRDPGGEGDPLGDQWFQNAVPPHSSANVNLMTVHASKGLQFQHIMLMDVHEPLRRQSLGSYLLSDEQTGKWGILARDRSEDKRKRTPFHRYLEEQEHERYLEESKRLFYVAVTRAKETVSLFGKKTNNINENSWLGQFPFLTERSL